jgi:Tfp pilus assembly protein PilF
MNDIDIEKVNQIARQFSKALTPLIESASKAFHDLGMMIALIQGKQKRKEKYLQRYNRRKPKP